MRIEKMMEPFPAEVDYDNISIEHVMLKEEQNRLRGHVERGAFSQGIPNPLEGELYLSTKSTPQQQPVGEQNNLQLSQPSANNNSMQQSTQNTEQYSREAAQAAARMAETGTGYEKPFPETTVSPNVTANRLSPSALSASGNLRGHLKKLERYSHKVADDGYGNATGGYGNVTPASKIGDHVGRQRAEQLLSQDIAEAERTVKRIVGNLPLHQNEYDALVDRSVLCLSDISFSER